MTPDESAARGDDHPNSGPHTECQTDHGGKGVPRHCRRGCKWPCPDASEPPKNAATCRACGVSWAACASLSQKCCEQCWHTAARATGALVAPGQACRCDTIGHCTRPGDGDEGLNLCRYCMTRIDPGYSPCPTLGFGDE